MRAPSIPANEAERLQNLSEYSILDSVPEKEYNAITQLASYISGSPISLISLIDRDRQWSKSSYGIEIKSMPRSNAFCAYAINTPNKVFIVPDLRKDDRFYDNPMVVQSGAVFYAGVPLVTPKGFALGTLCVIDSKPGGLNATQVEALQALAAQAISLLELRRNKALLEQSVEELEEKNSELGMFANIAAHDIKSPLNNISSFSQYLLKYCSSELTKDTKEIVQLLNDSSDKLKSLVNGILDHCKVDTNITAIKTEIDVYSFLQDTCSLFTRDGCEIAITPCDSIIYANETALTQILINLISNAIKYNTNQSPRIELDFRETAAAYSFIVKDNGPGIEKKYQNDVFEMFKVLSVSDKYGNRGNGIGLATVRKLVQKLKGRISLQSAVGEGSAFTVTIPKQLGQSHSNMAMAPVTNAA
jgi:signal transduction histidine kinase